MAQREFANQKALIAYAEQNDLAYEYEYTPAFAKWQRLLSPEQYEIVEARTSRGVSRVMLFSKAIIQAEWEANAPLREAMAIKRERGLRGGIGVGQPAFTSRSCAVDGTPDRATCYEVYCGSPVRLRRTRFVLGWSGPSALS